MEQRLTGSKGQIPYTVLTTWTKKNIQYTEKQLLYKESLQQHWRKKKKDTYDGSKILNSKSGDLQ